MEKTIHVTPADNLQLIFDTAPANAVIHLAEGEYRQKCVIRMPGLTLIGAGADKTKVIWDDYALKQDAFGQEYNTFRTYTLAICADHVSIQDLAIVNDSLHPEKKGQEVALSVLADAFSMRRCTLRSTQDTLFVGPLPEDLIERYDGFLRSELRRGGNMHQTFSDCLIEGTVDFIFGCGAATFTNCEIRSLADARGIGYVAAPAHGAEQSEGILFRNCRFTHEEGVPPGSIFLARPWRDYGLVRFESCLYADHIAAEGFDKWNDTRRDLTARFFESPAVPGRVPWVNRR